MGCEVSTQRPPPVPPRRDSRVLQRYPSSNSVGGTTRRPSSHHHTRTNSQGSATGGGLVKQGSVKNLSAQLQRNNSSTTVSKPAPIRRTMSASVDAGKGQRASEILPPPLPPNKPKMKKTGTTVEYVRTTEPPSPTPPSRPSTIQRSSSSHQLSRSHSGVLPNAANFKKKACRLCGELIGGSEDMVDDSDGRKYHRDCLKCAKCKLSLAGRRVVEGDAAQQLHKNECLLQRKGAYNASVLCELHAPRLSQPDSVARPASSGEEIERPRALSVKEKMQQAKDQMEAKATDSTPTCSRCGFSIERSQDIVVSGMARYHAVCPTKAEAALMPKSTRYFMKKTAERLVALVTCDASKAEKYSFIFQVDADSLAASLRKKDMYEDISLVFLPDIKARASVSRKLAVPTTRAFDFVIREFFDLSFADPSRGNELVEPHIEPERVTVFKFGLSNGVHIAVELVLGYDEPTFFIAPQRLVVYFTMWPPRESKSPGDRLSRKSLVDTNKVLTDYRLV